jgi:DNA-binding transcriptional LysR family regulator
LLLDHLDLILALTERGSISAAAEALGLTQSAVTKALSRAEKELGVPLFERQPRGVRPTAYGRALEAHATLIRRQCEDALVELTDLSGGEGGRVAVGSGAAFLDALLPTSVARLLAENPRIEFEIRGEPFPRLMELLREGRLDLLLVSEVPGLDQARDLAWTPLVSDEMDVVARAGHPVLDKPAIGLTDLLAYGWILGGGSDPQQQRLEAIFRSRGLPDPRVVVSTVSRAVAIEIVRQSDLFTLLPNARFQPPTRGIARVRCPEVTWRRTAGVIRRRGGVLHPAASRFIETLEEVCRGQYWDAPTQAA